MASKKSSRRPTRSTTSTTKSTPRKRVATRKAESRQEMSRSSTVKSPVRRVQTMNKWYLTAGLIIILLAGLLYIFRSLFVAAVVNGQPVSRFSVISDLERQSGKQALDTLVTKTLILQEAKKQNVTVSQDEINTETKKIEDNVKKQGQTLDQVLALQGMDRNALIDQIKIQKIVEKLLGKDITVTDKEVADYIDKNKDSLGTDPTSNATKTQVKQQLTQQKLSEKFQTWLQDLQKKAKIDYYVKY